MTQRIFCLSDSHGMEPEIPSGCDAALICGDFTNFETGGVGIFEQCRSKGIPAYFTSGNHESPFFCNELSRQFGCQYLDYSWVLHGEIFIAGIGGFDIFDSATRLKNISQFLSQLKNLQLSQKPKVSILMTHEPAWPWKYEGKVHGSEAVREVLHAWSFNLAITGHFHTDLPRWNREASLQPILNPGPDGCLLELTGALYDIKEVVWPY